jgi:hypothetical protein
MRSASDRYMFRLFAECFNEKKRAEFESLREGWPRRNRAPDVRIRCKFCCKSQP